MNKGEKGNKLYRKNKDLPRLVVMHTRSGILDPIQA